MDSPLGLALTLPLRLADLVLGLSADLLTHRFTHLGLGLGGNAILLLNLLLSLRAHRLRDPVLLACGHGGRVGGGGLRLDPFLGPLLDLLVLPLLATHRRRHHRT